MGVAFLEDHQFSTTTKLVGEVIMAVTAAGGSRSSEDNQAVFQDRIRLSFNTSFSGEDLLVTRLSASTGTGTDRFTLNEPTGSQPQHWSTHWYCLRRKHFNQPHCDPNL